MQNQNLSSLLPQFIKNLEDRGRSPSTILAYRADLEQLNSYLATRNKSLPTQIVSDDLSSFRDWLLAQKYTPKSTSRKLNAVKTFFRWLKDEGVIDSDASKEVGHPKIESSAPNIDSEGLVAFLHDAVAGKITLESRDHGSVGQISKEELLEKLLKEMKNKK